MFKRVQRNKSNSWQYDIERENVVVSLHGGQRIQLIVKRRERAFPPKSACIRYTFLLSARIYGKEKKNKKNYECDWNQLEKTDRERTTKCRTNVCMNAYTWTYPMTIITILEFSRPVHAFLSLLIFFSLLSSFTLANNVVQLKTRSTIKTPRL